MECKHLFYVEDEFAVVRALSTTVQIEVSALTIRVHKRGVPIRLIGMAHFPMLEYAHTHAASQARVTK